MSDRARREGTGLPAGSISSVRSRPLVEGWALCSTPPGAAADPAALDELSCAWAPAVVPGTVAMAAGPDGLDGHPDYDALDWWYRCDFEAEAAGRAILRLDGLATLAEVWLNGEQVLTTENMFAEHVVDVSDLLDERNDLAIAFRSLNHALAERRPRPRWKTNLVDHQQLRWFRTTLLGRIPGWTPAIRPVGPWRGVRLETGGPDVRTLTIRPRLEGGDGVVTVEAAGSWSAEGSPSGPGGIDSARLRVGEREAELDVEASGEGWRLSGELRVPDATLWWPATHGEPYLHEATLELTGGGDRHTVACGSVGFRSIEVDDADGSIRFVVNGVPVFCRGACWTTNDIVSLRGDRDAMRARLARMAEANANMIRVGGTMVYEEDDFYVECDRLGLLVWQDFMFANMDYPADDEGFMAAAESEVDQQLGRLARHPSVAAFCGGSEVQQQAAMFGATPETWASALFDRTMPELVERHAPGTPYWPSTPTGGVLPFHVGTGLAHYYGVGAYKRPLEDVRLAGVRFTPECLGFSNVPEPDNLRALGSHAAGTPHHPEWKRGVPRDSAAGWDFEDIRDHYLEALYGVDAVTLRSEDPARYLRLSRVVTGRVMAHVFAEWRAPESGCGGGLVWFMNDLRPGAGWGILDSEGLPKPVWHYLRRAWAPLTVFVLDRGLDGARVDVHNEAGEAVAGSLTVRIFSAGSALLAEATESITVPARGAASAHVEAMIGRFADPTYAYRFGPRAHAAIQARFEADGAPAVTGFHWIVPPDALPPAGLSGTIGPDGGGTVRTDALAAGVRLDLRGRVPAVGYFDLAPGEESGFTSGSATDATGSPRGYVEAENAPEGSRLAAES